MSKRTLVTTAIGSAFVASMTTAPVASAADNPFALSGLSSGYQVADHHMDKPKEGKCGGKTEADTKAKDGKCGGKTEAEMKAKEAGTAKMKDGKCGEGKCGAKK